MNRRPTVQELHEALQEVETMIETLEAMDPPAQAREEWEQTLREAYETGVMLLAEHIRRGIEQLQERCAHTRPSE